MLRPHCDGNCQGDFYVPGGRVATGLLYCQAATRGGATTFSKSDIFVVPKRGQATFFAYKGLDGRMDDGSTQHSGCPVLEGKLMFLPSLLVFLSMRGVLMCVRAILHKQAKNGSRRCGCATE